MVLHRKSLRSRYVVATLLLVAVTLVAIDVRSRGGGITGHVRNAVSDVVGPIQAATHDALAPIGDFITGAVDYKSLSRQNQQLRDQVAGMSVAAAQAAAA